MDTVEPHGHAFAAADWPFADPVNALAISTVPVVRRGLPVLRVSHNEDGDWQVLCGTTTETKDALVVCLGCCYQRDPSIGELADLPRGWAGWREAVGEPWQRERNEPWDDED